MRTRKQRKLSVRKEKRRVPIRLLVVSNQEFFTVILVTYLLLLLLEEIKEGFVSNFLNLNIILGITLISGIITVFGGESKKKEIEHFEKKDYMWVFALGVVGAALIFYKTRNLGTLSYLISAISGILIILLSVLILEDNSSTKRQKERTPLRKRSSFKN